MIDVADPLTDERLYRDLAPELIRFATAFVGRAEAADVMSNAFAKSMASRSWPAVVNRRAYLYRAVHNEARTHAKRSMRRAERERRAANDGVPGWLIERPDGAVVVWPADETTEATLMWYGTRDEALAAAEAVTFIDSPGAWMARYDIGLPSMPNPYAVSDTAVETTST